MFIVSSVLFNHEGPRRGHTFVTQKIVDYVVKYSKLKGQGIIPLELGNLNARRDWSYANDMIHGIYLMLMQDKPENYVLASGTTYSVRDFVELAFKEIQIDIKWLNSGINEVGVDTKTNNVLIKVNPRYYRDIDIETLIGDASKAKQKLGWECKTTFLELVKIMINSAFEKFEK